jgi:hypothetical protein
MSIRFACPVCRTVAEVPDSSAGARSYCPACGLQLQVPAAPPTPPEAICVQVSARTLAWPQKCACCGGKSSVSLRLLQARGQGQQDGLPGEGYWEAPYCSDCLAHVRRTPGSRRKSECCSAGPAVIYDGTEGKVHSFRFLSTAYAARFIEANADRCLWMLRSDPAARKAARG